ncbi:NAD(P)H-dependent oxidoreductase [Rhodovibrio salinarum]|uniref:NAD(P)H-dependent oxidoreductase n=1 Tax=Rhodovibrio salinarum TaxID=1087 RepID=UPI0004AF56B1|nr:NAD(P)H-dependent oxidoreductase [Rhodovibrio salinarum]
MIDIVTDAEKEARALLDADRIVLQFPIQWYSTPALFTPSARILLPRRLPKGL